MAAAAQEPNVPLTSAPMTAFKCPSEHWLKIWRKEYSWPKILSIWGSDSPYTESTHNSKENASLPASVIYYYPGTQDPNGTGTGLAIACDNGGPYYVVNDHTLNKNDWFCAPLNGCSPGPKLWLSACTFGRAAFDDLKDMEDSAAATTARVSEAANPGGATVVLVLDSGASIHAVGEARIMRGIQLYSPPMLITLPDGFKLRIIGTGTIEMNGFSIPNVSLVEGLKKNLISVGQLDKDHGLCCCFHRGHCRVIRPGGTLVGGAILEDDGLYKLRFLEVLQPEE